MYAFPQCIATEKGSVGLPLCYEDCIAVRGQLCYNDWAVIEHNKKQNIFFKSRGHFELPDCDQLPKFNPKNDTPSCSHARLTELKTELITCTVSFLFLTITTHGSLKT